MKIRQLTLFTLSTLVPAWGFAQLANLNEAWNDPQFVEQFAGSFLPLTDQEPKITESESELFQELGDLLATNQNQVALQRLQQTIRSAGDPPPSAAVNYTYANLLLQSERYAEAVFQYEESIRKFPNFRRAWKNLGLARIQSGMYSEAINALVKAIELGDSAGDTFGLLAFSYLNDGNPVAALEGYRQASLLNPNNKEWRIGKAEALMRTERYEEAIAQFKQLLNETPERNAFYTSIANAYLSLDDSKTASYFLEILRRRGQAKSSALGLLGDIYVNEGLAPLALHAYRDAIKAGGFSTVKAIRALKAFLSREHYTEAQSLYDDIESRYAGTLSEEENREVLNLSAQLSLALGEDQKAATILEQVLQEDPLNGNALMLLGDYNQKQEDIQSAIFYYQRALDLPEFQRDAQLQLALIYVRQKEYLKAIRQLEAALDLEYSANVSDFLDAVRSAYNRSL